MVHSKTGSCVPIEQAIIRPEVVEIVVPFGFQEQAYLTDRRVTYTFLTMIDAVFTGR
jgi:hypothetical protein